MTSPNTSAPFSHRFWRTWMACFVAAAVALAAAALCSFRASAARADDAPSSRPSTRPSPEDFIEGLHEQIGEMSEALGGLSADEKAKLDALEKQIGDQVKADPSKMHNDTLKVQFIMGVRAALSPEHQKKFDEMMEQSRKRMMGVATAAGLRQLGMSIMLYANEHEGKTPPDLGALMGETMPMPRLFLAAGSKTKVPDNWAKMTPKEQSDWVNQNTDFVYLGAGSSINRLAADFVVAYVKPEACVDGNNFLRADGSVWHQTTEQATKVIEDLKAGKNPPPSLKED